MWEYFSVCILRMVLYVSHLRRFDYGTGNCDKGADGEKEIVSPEEYGFHKVIVPGREDCQEAAMYRLNLAAGQRYELKPGGEEMNGVCIKGEAGLDLAGRHYHCGRFDSFYTAGGNSVAIEAERGFL